MPPFLLEAATTISVSWYLRGVAARSRGAAALPSTINFARMVNGIVFKSRLPLLTGY